MRAIYVVMLAPLLGCTETSRYSTVLDHNIRIALEKPIEQSEGFTWPESADGQPEFAAIEQQHVLTVQFPSGRLWTTQSQLTFLSQDDRILTEVVVTPLRKTATFIDALSHLRNTAEIFDVNQDELYVQKMSEWSEKPPVWDPFATKSFRFEVEPGINLFAEIRPSTEGGRWIVSYSFTVAKYFTQGQPPKTRQRG